MQCTVENYTVKNITAWSIILLVNPKYAVIFKAYLKPESCVKLLQ